MKNSLILIGLLLMTGCMDLPKADLIIYNANIYTVDSLQPQAGAVAVIEGKIFSLANNLESLLHMVDSTGARLLDAKGQFVMPGFIEGHGHFSGLGKSLIDINLLKTKSWEEIISAVAEKVKTAEPGAWIEGRGWHQEKWDSLPVSNVQSYPYHDQLSRIAPDNPVVLIHASGHSLFANEKAMSISGITSESKDPPGGRIVRDHMGNAAGVFEERAMRPIKDALQAYKDGLDQRALAQLWESCIEKASEECLRKGITSFQDAGSKLYELDRYKALADAGKLDLRLWVMARDSFGALEHEVAQRRVIDAGGGFYTCRAIKSEVDGALGAFGAWLLEPYNDKPGFFGQNTTDIYEVKRLADLSLTNDMQFCVHAIGDRANRVVLDIFEGVFQQHPDKSDLRWRVEHAQHINPVDIPRFAKNGIIASMQGVHCTSDAPFVEKRLGTERAREGAYAWRSFLDAGVVIANGTDAPVEDVDPLVSLYASVTRKRPDLGLVFFSEQAMTRAEAIYSYTLGNAYAAFEEKVKGSISPGKYADMVILSKDLIQCEDEEILSAEVLYTIVGGEIKFSK